MPSTGRSASFVAPRWLLAPGGAVLAISVAALALLWRVTGLDPYDLKVYLLGGNAYRHGAAVYSQEMISHSGVGYFTYPPLTLLAFGPLSFLPVEAAHAIMLVLDAVALFAVVWLTLRMLGGRPDAGLAGVTLGVVGLALWLQPVFDSLLQGQVNLPLMLLVVADFAILTGALGADHRNRPARSPGRWRALSPVRWRGWLPGRWPVGLLVGVAAAVKLTPAIFIVYLLLVRERRAALTAAATAAVLTGLGFVAAWGDSVTYWLHGTFADADRVVRPLTVGDVSNQSLHGVMVRLLGDGPGGAAWYPVVTLAMAGGAWVAVAAYRAGEVVAGMLACAVTGLLVSPVSWNEHWVWVVPVLVAVGDLARRARAERWVLAGALPCLCAVFLMWPRPADGGGGALPGPVIDFAGHLWVNGHHDPLVAAVEAAYVVAGVVLLAGCGWALYRRRGLTGEEAPARPDHPDAIPVG